MQLAAEMRKRTPQLRCMFALPFPNVFIRAGFEIGPAVGWCWRVPRTQQTPRTGRAGCWERLPHTAVGKGGRAASSPSSASSCPAPAEEARCGGRMLRGMRGGEQDWGAAFLVPSCARGLLELDDYCSSVFWSPSSRDVSVMAGSLPGPGAPTQVIPTPAWFWEQC